MLVAEYVRLMDCYLDVITIRWILDVIVVRTTNELIENVLESKIENSCPSMIRLQNRPVSPENDFESASIFI